MAHHAHSPGPQQPAPQAQAPKKKSGLKWGMVALGCGCLGLVVLLGVGGVGMYWYMQTSDATKDSRVAKALRGESVDEGDDEGDEQKRDWDEFGRSDELMTPPNLMIKDRVPRALRDPLTKKDVDEFLAFIAKWRKHPDHKKLLSLGTKARKNQNMPPDDTLHGASVAVKKDRDIWKGEGAHLDHKVGRKHSIAVVEEFETFNNYFSRLAPITALAIGTEHVSKEHGIDDPNSDEAAGKLLAIYNEIGPKLHEMQRLVEAGKNAEANKVLPKGKQLEVVATPSLNAMRYAPKETYELWVELSADKRKELRHALRDTRTVWTHGEPRNVLGTMISTARKRAKK